MKKKTFITLIAFISVLCFGLTACAGSSSNKKNGDNDSEYEVTDNYPEDDYGYNEDYDSDRKVCFGSVFGSQMHKYNNFYLWIPYNKIQMFFRRRYFFKKQAIEIFTEDRKSYFFKVKDTSIDYFIDNIKYYMKQDIEDICILYNKFGEKIGFMNKNNILLNFNMNFIYYEKKNPESKKSI